MSVASYLHALAEISSTLTVHKVQDAINSSLRAICETLTWPLAELWIWEGTRLQLRYFWHDGSLGEFVGASKRMNLEPGEGLQRQVFIDQLSEFTKDLAAEPLSKRAELAAKHGLVCALTMPVRTEHPPTMALVLFDRVPRTDIEHVQPTIQVACDVLAFFISWSRVTQSSDSQQEFLDEDGGESAGTSTALTLDPDGQVIHGPQGALRLTGMEWLVLKALHDNRGRVTNHRDLLLNLWGAVDRNSRSSLYEIVSRLRRHMRDVGADDQIIRNVARQGYLLENVF
jgi:hypothetical protein